MGRFLLLAFMVFLGIPGLALGIAWLLDWVECRQRGRNQQD